MYHVKTQFPFHCVCKGPIPNSACLFQSIEWTWVCTLYLHLPVLQSLLVVPCIFLLLALCAGMPIWHPWPQFPNLGVWHVWVDIKWICISPPERMFLHSLSLGSVYILWWLALLCNDHWILSYFSHDFATPHFAMFFDQIFTLQLLAQFSTELHTYLYVFFMSNT